MQSADVQVESVVLSPLGLDGALAVPDSAEGLVLFAHGSCSSRLSPGSRFVARELQGAGLATLQLDLLTEAEAADHASIFDIDLLAHRLLAASDWAAKHAGLGALPLAYFAASTGAAAALFAAAASRRPIAAVVSRGGRPDLAGAALADVTSPTLLIVGGRDREILSLNREALRRLRCEKELAVVPGATHLFDEPGALEAVAALACEWFMSHVQNAPAWSA